VTQTPQSIKTSLLPDDDTLEGDEKVILAGAKLFSVQALRDIITAEAVDRAIEAIEGLLPGAAKFNIRGQYQTGETYYPNDLAYFTLADGRVGSYTPLVQTTTVPTDANEWFPLSVPAAGAGGASALTNQNMSTIVPVNANVTLSDTPGRYIYTTDASKPIEVTNLGVYRGASLVLKVPTTVANVPPTFATTIEWEEGVAPTFTTRPGYGTEVLLRSFEGTKVSGKVVDPEIFFEASTLRSLSTAKVLYRYEAAKTPLNNLLATRDHLTSEGAVLTPQGLDHTGTQMSFNDAHINIDFNQPWFAHFVVPELNLISGGLTPFGFASITTADQVISPRVSTVFTDFNPSMTFHVQSSSPAFAGFLTNQDTCLPINFALPANRAYSIFVAYDGAGQYNLVCSNNGTRMIYATGTNKGAVVTSGLYPRGNSANIADFSGGLATSLSGSRYSSTLTRARQTPSKHRYATIAQALLTPALVLESHENARLDLAELNATGWQLDAGQAPTAIWGV
jgi:hypothetical protein